MNINLKRLINKLNPACRMALESAAGMCLSRTHYDIEIEHYLLKLLDTQGSDFDFISREFGLDRIRFTNELAHSMDRLRTGNIRTPTFSPYLVTLLSEAWLYGSLEHDANQIRSGFTIVALMGEPELARLTQEFSREMALIRMDVLTRDFVRIVSGSIEDERPEPDSKRPATGGARVFISYRREDSSFYVDYLYATILAEVPDVRIFRDSDTLEPGMVYTEKIEETIGACDIVLAVIGRKWAAANSKTGARRIDLSDDWVRLELAAALKQGKTVIPCLVGGARMPAAVELPPDLTGLNTRHAVAVSQSDMRRDARVLIDSLKAWRRG